MQRGKTMKHFLLSVGLVGLAACAQGGTSDMMEAENLVIVKQIYADFESGKIDKFVAALDPAIVWNEAENNLYAPDSPYTGVEAIMGDVFAPLAQEWEFFSVEPGSFMSDGDHVAMFGRYKAKYNITGKIMNPQIVHLWTLKDGKVTAFQQHMDTLAQKEAMTPENEAEE